MGVPSIDIGLDIDADIDSVIGVDTDVYFDVDLINQDVVSQNPVLSLVCFHKSPSP